MVKDNLTFAVIGIVGLTALIAFVFLLGNFSSFSGKAVSTPSLSYAKNTPRFMLKSNAPANLDEQRIIARMPVEKLTDEQLEEFLARGWQVEGTELVMYDGVGWKRYTNDDFITGQFVGWGTVKQRACVYLAEVRDSIGTHTCYYVEQQPGKCDPPSQTYLLRTEIYSKSIDMPMIKDCDQWKGAYFVGGGGQAPQH